jgi:hypothetical protein
MCDDLIDRHARSILSSAVAEISSAVAGGFPLHQVIHHQIKHRVLAFVFT